jgi:nitrite reductase/ring-hydroxylating ferredoxin subunit
MIRYVKVAELHEFAGGRSKRVVVENVEMALFFIQGQFYAVQNECPHQHYSALHQGILNGLEITCPMHGWVFDIPTGQAIVGGGRLKSYAVKTEGNDILVEVPDPEPDWAKK